MMSPFNTERAAFSAAVLPARRGIVEGENALDCIRDRGCFVVRGNRDADERPGRGGSRLRRHAAAEAQQLEERGIAEVRIEGEAERHGERDVRRDRHGSTGTADPALTSW